MNEIWLIYRKTKHIEFDKIVDFCETEIEAEFIRQRYEKHSKRYYYFYGRLKQGDHKSYWKWMRLNFPSAHDMFLRQMEQKKQDKSKHQNN